MICISLPGVAPNLLIPRMLSATALVTLLGALASLSQVNGADLICADACLTLATNYVYSGCNPDDELSYACRCISPEFLGTLALCVQGHCDPKEWGWLDVEICQNYGETKPIPGYEVVVANATRFAGEAPENATFKALTYPVRFSEEVFETSFDTSADFIGNMTDASFFGYPPLHVMSPIHY